MENTTGRQAENTAKEDAPTNTIALSKLIATVQGWLNLELECPKFESELILRGLDSADPNERANYLSFLVESDLLSSRRLDKAYVDSLLRTPGPYRVWRRRRAQVATRSTIERQHTSGRASVISWKATTTRPLRRLARPSGSTRRSIRCTRFAGCFNRTANS